MSKKVNECKSMGIPMDIQLAKLLRDYDNRPSSDTWRRIQALAAEILKQA